LVALGLARLRLRREQEQRGAEGEDQQTSKKPSSFIFESNSLGPLVVALGNIVSEAVATWEQVRRKRKALECSLRACIHSIFFCFFCTFSLTYPNLPLASLLLLFDCWRSVGIQDFANIEAGHYKQPWDQDMGFSHRQVRFRA